MSSLMFLFILGDVVGICILIWFKTKSGKKWLRNL